MDTPSWQELFDLGAQEALYRNPRLSLDAIRAEGSNVNALLAAMATMGEELSYAILRTGMARLLSTATGAELDRLAWDLFKLRRQDAVAATVQVAFARTSTIAEGVIPLGTKVAAGTSEFTTTVAVQVPAGTAGVNAEAQAAQAGSAGNVAAHQITQVRSSLFDRFTVDNAVAAGGGSDREDDEAFRARCAQYWSVVQRATLRAIEFGACTVPGVRLAQAVDTGYTDAMGREIARWVGLTVADATGTGNAAMAASVKVALDAWRAAGVAVSVQWGTPVYQQIVATCAFRPEADTAMAKRRVRQAIVDYTNSHVIAELFDPASLRDVMRRDPDVVLSPADKAPRILLPTGPVQPDAAEVVRTRLDLVSLNP